MTARKQVVPGRLTVLQAKVGMVVAILFLLFGIGFGFAIMQETPSSESGLRLLQVGFFLIWVAVCVALIVIYGRVLSRHSGSNTLVEITEQQDHAGDPGPAGHFAERLRQLEGLKRDGLISEEEFQVKRAQILDEKW